MTWSFTYHTVIDWRLFLLGSRGLLVSAETMISETWCFIETKLLCSHLSELPWWLSSKEPACQYSRCKFDPWVQKVPWRRKWQPTLVFLPPYLGTPLPQKPTQVCPLVETGGEFRPARVHKPFSLLELRQIKQDLGSYTDDPGKCKYIPTHYLGLWPDVKGHHGHI